MIHLSKATLADIDGIAAVVDGVWQQDILPGVCAAQIETDTAALWVAKEKDEVLGFMSAFVTVNAQGRRRWEMDLVAVRSTRQGEGLGQRLIARVWQEGGKQDCHLARALIHVDNAPSQRAFEKARFATDRRVYHLLLWPPALGAEPARCPDGVSLIPVDTVTYRGLWIEGLEDLESDWQRLVVSTARARVARENRLNTGAIIPAEAALVPELRNQATLQGEYQWFVKRNA